MPLLVECSSINQSRISSIIDGITLRRWNIDGVPTSLADLGYSAVGIDEYVNSVLLMAETYVSLAFAALCIPRAAAGRRVVRG
jgi:hypothetical protein